MVEARQRYSRGVELFDRGQPTLALEEFRRAYELAPNYQVLYNLGLVNSRLGRAAEALQQLREYLRLGGDRIPAARRAAVDAAIEEQTRRLGFLTIAANVGGASVQVDGVYVGTTPLREPVVVSAGPHEVVVVADGYTRVTRAVRVAGRETLDLAVDLARRAETLGQLQVTGELVDVVIEVDATPRGSTPDVRTVRLAPGEHRVRLSRAGYVARVTTVALAPGEVVDVDAQLEPRAEGNGRLRLQLPDAEGTVTVDGHLVSGRQVELPTGRHRVRVELVERRPHVQEIQIERGQTLDVAPVLRWAELARDDRETSIGSWVAAWSVLGVGVVTTLTGTIMSVREARGLATLRREWSQSQQDLFERPSEIALADREEAAQQAFVDAHSSARRRVYVRGSVAAAGLITTWIGLALLRRRRSARDIDIAAHVASNQGVVMATGSF